MKVPSRLFWAGFVLTFPLLCFHRSTFWKSWTLCTILQTLINVWIVWNTDGCVAGCWLLIVGCWLLVAGCWLLVPRAHCPLLSWVISSQGNGCGPWERWRWGRAQSSAGASSPVPYRDTSSRVVQVVLLVHRPAASCVRLHRVYNWVRAKVTDGGGWVWQAQENMSLFSLKHPRVADHALWWDICHWIFVLII